MILLPNKSSQKYIYFALRTVSDSDSHTIIQSKKVLQMPKKKFLPIMMLHWLCLRSTPRCSQIEKRKLDRYAFHATIEEPVSVKDALMQKEWIDAMNSQMGIQNKKK